MAIMRFVVEEEAIRLDVFLAAATGLSRRKTRKLIEAGSVFVDESRVKVQSRILPKGCCVKTHGQLLEKGEEVAPLEILALSREWIAVNKPVGMPTLPTEQASAGTALDELSKQLAQQGNQDSSPARQTLHPVHRLDRETSGVLLFARNAKAAEALSLPFRERTAQRRYLALVEGHVAENFMRVTAPIRKSAKGKAREVHPEGQSSTSLFTVLLRGKNKTLLSCAPITGRTHQLRLHLAHLGHPLVGDRLYGASKTTPGLFGLHALFLEVGTSSGPLRFSAPPPKIWVQACANDGLSEAALHALQSPYRER
ncbi:MAG: RluA family pseudouridine synthase [Deltaproteobacteria bacterium]|nr:RluA family pseudouridine synthase [Deltaproteobacteria bacterium]